jgi:hypothetical protein
MQLLRRTIFLLSWMVILPASAYAQAALAGVVKDSSGAVLPGVTVEASSPALIEKVRSVVTDGSGQYKIENLRPGTYVVTPGSTAPDVSLTTPARDAWAAAKPGKSTTRTAAMASGILRIDVLTSCTG